MLELLSPPTSIDSLSFALLISISALSSFITASIGIGGGMIMLAVLAQALPISAVISYRLAACKQYLLYSFSTALGRRKHGNYQITNLC